MYLWSAYFVGGKEQNNRRAWSSSLIWTSIFFKSIIIELKSARLDLMDVSFAIRSINKHCFKYNKFVRKFVIYKNSNLCCKPSAIFPSEPSHKTSSDEHNWIAIRSLSSISSFCSSVEVLGIFSLTGSAFCNPCCIKTTRILICHKPKLLKGSHFSISNFVSISRSNQTTCSFDTSLLQQILMEPKDREKKKVQHTQIYVDQPQAYIHELGWRRYSIIKGMEYKNKATPK